MSLTFRTIVNVLPAAKQITYHSPSMWVGSCFTENIGQQLQQAKLPTHINPFGILYNPISIAKCLTRLTEEQLFTPNDIYQNQQQYFSFEHHHARFANSNAAECLSNINQQLISSAAFLRQTHFLFITFGTAWVYKLVDNGQIVGNCHKLPAKQFTKELLSVGDIVSAYKRLIEQLLTQLPNLQVIFTLSPLRHWSDGAAANQHSKACLLVAIHQICELFPQATSYFPAYEIMMDDLRDYRFYAADMLHPNTTAINYIYQQFEQAYLHPEAQKLHTKIAKIQAAAHHRPFDAQSVAHQRFVNNTLQQINQLQQQYPTLNFETERAILTNPHK